MNSETKAIWGSTIMGIIATIVMLAGSFALIKEKQETNASNINEIKDAIKIMVVNTNIASSDIRNLTTLLTLNKDEIVDIRKQQLQDRQHCDEVMLKELELLNRQLDTINKTLVIISTKK